MLNQYIMLDTTKDRAKDIIVAIAMVIEMVEHQLRLLINVEFGKKDGLREEQVFLRVIVHIN